MSLLSGIAATASNLKHGMSVFDRRRSSLEDIQESLLEARQNLQRAALNPKTSPADLKERITTFNTFCNVARISNDERIKKIDSLMKLHFGIVTKDHVRQIFDQQSSDEWVRQSDLADILSLFTKSDIVDAINEMVRNGDFFLSVAENPAIFFDPDRELVAYGRKLDDLQGHISLGCLRELTARMQKMERAAEILMSFSMTSWNLCTAFREDNLVYDRLLEEYNKILSPEHESSIEFIQKSRALRNMYLDLIEAPCFLHRKADRASRRHDDEYLKKIEGAIQKAEYHLATKDLLEKVREEEREYLKLRAECNRNQNPELEICVKLYSKSASLSRNYVNLIEIPCFRPDGKTGGDVLFLQQIERTQTRIEAYLKKIIKTSSQTLADLLTKQQREIRAMKNEVMNILSEGAKQLDILAPFIACSENQELGVHFNFLLGLHAQVTSYNEESWTYFSQIKDYAPSFLYG